jgi:hypothetical protein
MNRCGGKLDSEKTVREPQSLCDSSPILPTLNPTKPKLPEAKLLKKHHPEHNDSEHNHREHNHAHPYLEPSRLPQPKDTPFK